MRNHDNTYLTGSCLLQAEKTFLGLKLKYYPYAICMELVALDGVTFPQLLTQERRYVVTILFIPIEHVFRCSEELHAKFSAMITETLSGDQVSQCKCGSWFRYSEKLDPCLKISGMR